MSGKVNTAIISVAGLAVCAVFVYVLFKPVDQPAAAKSVKAEQVQKRVKKSKLAPAKRVGKPAAKKVKVPRNEEVEDSWITERAPEHRKLAKSIVDASDNDDLNALQKLVDAASSCPDEEIRLRMVEALSWFDKDALPEITGFLNDRNEEVAQSAFNAWDSAVDMIDSEETRIKASTMAMKMITDGDSLAGIAAKFEAAEDRKMAINALVDVIGSGNEKAASAAKEAYEFIAEEEWRSPERAKLKALTVGRDVE